MSLDCPVGVDVGACYLTVWQVISLLSSGLVGTPDSDAHSVPDRCVNQ